MRVFFTMLALLLLVPMVWCFIAGAGPAGLVLLGLVMAFSFAGMAETKKGPIDFGKDH